MGSSAGQGSYIQLGKVVLPLHSALQDWVLPLVAIWTVDFCIYSTLPTEVIEFFIH
jgi:hypothetical protein